MSTEKAFDALVGALTAYAMSVPENSEREVKVTDLIKDSKTRELLLLLDGKWLNTVALQATCDIQDELKKTKPCSTFEVTFQNPGRYRIVHSTLPPQR